MPAAEISLREATAGSLVRGMITFDDETRKDDEDEEKKTAKRKSDRASICAKTFNRRRRYAEHAVCVCLLAPHLAGCGNCGAT